jgi:putative hydrolase of the HAD superfamily
MRAIGDATVFPPAHAALLAAVRRTHRIGLVSNFDDTGACYDILLRHGITPFLDTVVVSEALGLRKPHPGVLRAGLLGLGLPAADVLFVGDTWAEDVAGARAAGVDVAWIDRQGVGVPAGDAPPRAVVRALPEVHALLGG